MAKKSLDERNTDALERIAEALERLAALKQKEMERG